VFWNVNNAAEYYQPVTDYEASLFITCACL
jgi:hypothetical protein